MDFRKTLKQRLIRNLFCLLFGIALIAAAFVTQKENQFLSSFGCALAAIGIAQGLRNIRLMRNPEACKRREIAESDERNIMLANKAKSWAFSLYMILIGAAVLVLSLMEKHEIAAILGYTVCILIGLYYVCYLILKKKY